MLCSLPPLPWDVSLFLQVGSEPDDYQVFLGGQQWYLAVELCQIHDASAAHPGAVSVLTSSRRSPTYA